jgi:hypothetical protein
MNFDNWLITYEMVKQKTEFNSDYIDKVKI